MPEHTELIATMSAAISAAFLFGTIAHRLKLPLIVGYLLAGAAIGPFTPGFVADPEIAPQLAEIGVILLMFGVGLHFSVNDLLAVRRLALPGAIGQVAIATGLGVLLTRLWGWDLGAGIVFGLALSVASTVVLLRTLTHVNGLESHPGRVAVGWLVVEDLITVLVLVLLPAFAGILSAGSTESLSTGAIVVEVVITLAKVGLFIAIMLVLASRAVPWLLHRIEHTGSRELFILAVLAAAMGISYASAEVFGVSFALGAFLAGVVVNGSEFSHRAGEEALPLREAFSVLFFVSVGMLIDPSFLLDEPLRLSGVVAIVMIGKAVAALVLVRLMGGSTGVGLVVAAGLSQVGEFSFILAEAAHAQDIFADEGRNLILGAALISITLNPALFALALWLSRRLGEPMLESPGGAGLGVSVP